MPYDQNRSGSMTDRFSRRTFIKGTTLLGLGGGLLGPGMEIPAGHAAEARTLVMAVQGTPASIDGDQASTAEGEMMMANVHGGDLFSYKVIKDPNSPNLTADLKATGVQGVTGLLAQTWNQSPDGTVVTVELRHGMKSPYGNEVTANDYKWAWQRRWVLNGVGKFIGDVVGIASPDSIEVLGKYTVRIHLKGPSPVFYKALAQNYYGGPFDSTEVKNHLTAGDPWGKQWTRTHAAGFGPYTVDQLVPGVQTVLTPNPNWTLTPIYFQRVIVKAVPESSARLALLKAGEVDIAWALSERELHEVEGNSNLQVLRVRANKQLYMGLGVDKPPFNNKTLRQAMAWATPYKDIIDKVYLGHARRMTSIVPDIYSGYKYTYHYDYDPQKAKQLMAKAGFANGFDVKLTYNAAEKEAEDTAILVKSAWGQIGARVSLQALPTAVWAEQKYGKHALQAFVENQQYPWTGDPGYSCWVYLGGGPSMSNNAVNYNNSAFNALLEKSMRMLDSPQRAANINQLQEIIADEVPWVQIAWFDWTVAAKKGLGGFLWMPDNMIRFYYLRRLG